MSCSVGAFNAAYHTKIGVYHHEMGIKKGGTGFDDVFCYAPVAAVVELCSAVLGRDYAQFAKDSGRQKRCCNSEKTLSVVGTDRVSFGVKVRYSAHTPIRRQYLYIAPRKSEQKLLTESENKKNRLFQTK